jgi:hypothetical protein
MVIAVTPAHEEFAARIGRAGVCGDADGVDAILDEIAGAGVECALAVLAVQSRNLIWMLKLTQGEDAARALFEKTIIDAGAACDD